MKPVTDPAILGQLEGGPGRAPVTDPAVLAQLNDTPAPGFAERAGRLVGKGLASIRDAYRGDAEFPDAHELPQLAFRDGEMFPIQDKLAVARGNPIGQAAIFQNYFPKAEVLFDSAGHPYVQAEGRKFYLNQPGLSLQDVNEGVQTMATAAAAARGGKGLFARFGLAGKVTGAAGGAGSASVGWDAAARNLQDSPQPYDLPRAFIESLGGAGGEIAQPVVKGVFGKVFGSKALFDSATGRVTERGAELLRRAGVDPKMVTREFVEAFADQASDALEPKMAAGLAEAKTLPKPVRLSTGDVTRDVTQQAFEDSAAKGAYGEGARNVMAPFREAQQAELKANLPAIQERLAGGAPKIAGPGEGASRAQQTLTKLRGEEWGKVGEAYDAARATEARVAAEPVLEWAKEARRSLTGSYDVGALPGVQRALGDFERFANIDGGKITAMKVRGLEQWRTRVTNAIRGAERNNPTEAGALKRLRADYDRFMDRALDEGLLQGDDAAISAWRGARGLRREFAERFESDKIVQKLTEAEATPEQALNYLFGAGRLGAKTDTAVALGQIKRLLGDTSPEWKALKEEAFLRLLRRQEVGPRGPNAEVLFSGTKFASDLSAAMREAPSLMKGLFDPEELALFQQFARVALRATDRVPGAVNTSGSATELARITQRMFGSGSDAVRVLWQRFGQPYASQGRAGRAAAGVLPSQGGSGVPAGVGAVAAGETTRGSRTTGRF